MPAPRPILFAASNCLARPPLPQPPGAARAPVRPDYTDGQGYERRKVLGIIEERCGERVSGFELSGPFDAKRRASICSAGRRFARGSRGFTILYAMRYE